MLWWETLIALFSRFEKPALFGDLHPRENVLPGRDEVVEDDRRVLCVGLAVVVVVEDARQPLDAIDVTAS